METIERGPDGVTSGASARQASRNRRRRRQRIVMSVLGLVLVAGLGGMIWFGVHNAHRGPANLQTAKVTRLDIVETVSATGSVTAQTGAMVKIGSDVTGRIKHLYADVGSHVESGQIIAELDVPEMVAQTRAAADNLELARQKLAEQGTAAAMQSRQNVNTVENAEESLRSARIKRDEAAQLLSIQTTQYETDLSKARAAVVSAQASEAQAKSAYAMQVATARAAVRRSTAALKNSQAILKRKQALFAKGYVSASDVDQATADEASAAAQVDSDQQNLSLAETNGQSTIKTTHEQTVQAQAALTATKAEQLEVGVKRQDLASADSAVRQASAQLDTARAGLMQNDILRRQVAEARTSVAASTDQLNVDQSQLSKAFIRSPISGTVLQLNAQQGETLVAGYSAAPVVTVADLNRLQISALVDETDIAKIKAGQPATVTVDAFPDQPFDGVVSKVASGSTLQQNVVTYGVTVAIKDPHHLLKPDMTATVDITVSSHRKVMAVPDEAVKPQGMDSYVGIIPAGSTQPEKRKVVIGPSDGTHTEIISGLKEGDTVVISGWSPVKSDGNAFFRHD